MNKTRKCLLSVLLALMMLLSSLAALGGTVALRSAGALTDDYDGSDGTIYYFADSYFPVLDSATLEAAYGGDSVYDIQNGIDSDTLQQLINAGYFDGFGSGCIVIIEITGSLIDSSVLAQLFEILKNQGCIVIFISAYDEGDYEADVMEYVDAYLQSTGSSKFYNYIVNAVTDMASNGLSATSCILLDSQLVDLSGYDGDFQALCESSVFLRTLLQQICEYLDITFDEENFGQIAEELTGLGFHLLVHIGGTYYVDLLAWDVNGTVCDYAYEIDDINTLEQNVNATEYFAMGIWSLDSNYYKLLKGIQDYFEDNKLDEELLVYIWEVDPITYSSNGLWIITDTDLRERYGSGDGNDDDDDDDMSLLLEILEQFI